MVEIVFIWRNTNFSLCSFLVYKLPLLIDKKYDQLFRVPVLGTGTEPADDS